jgi:hypothetical protein
MEDAAMPVGPIHHGRATKFPIIFNHLRLSVGPVLGRHGNISILISLGFLELVRLSSQFLAVRCYKFATELARASGPCDS